ncbi:MAG: AAA family ATPase [Actinomycetota bacterium]
MTVWERFVGHPRVLKILQGAADRPTGTYLLVGSPGAGKSIAARVLAAALVCPDACGRCHRCERVFKQLHPDVTVLHPEGYTHPVEVLRSAAAAAAQTPIEAAHRVFIIEEADRIPERSQNALLKALEEPNASVVWILLTDAVDAFLPTVLSRCQIIDFPPVGEHALLGQLQSSYSLSAAEAAGLIDIAHADPDAIIRLIEQPEETELRNRARRLAAIEDLTLSEALKAAEEVMKLAADTRSRVEKAQAQRSAELAEVSGKEGLGAWKKRQAERDKRQLRRVEAEAQAAFVYWMAVTCREIAALSAGGPGAGSESDPQLCSAAARRDPKFWVDMMQRCLDAQTAIRNNANAALAIEALLLRFV